MPFINAEQMLLSEEIGAMLSERGQTVAVAEATSGGLVSAALLAVAGASRYYAGGGVLYTRNSRLVLGGMPPAVFANYRGTTNEIIMSMAESMRERLGATWCVAESGTAGPTGNVPGRTMVGVSGPVKKVESIETGFADREANMAEFATVALRLLRDALREAGG
jgi:PncC family amidohydrolase